MRLLSAAVLAAALSTSPANADCVDDFKTILAAPTTAGPYVLESTSGQGKGSTTIEVAASDAAHLKRNGGNSSEEFIWLDGHAWQKIEQKWAAVPPESMHLDMILPTTLLDHVGSAECLGTQQFDGKDYLAFSADLPGPGMAATVYADLSTHLPAVLTVFTVHGAAREMALFSTYRYRYDPSIAVSAPM